MKSTLGCVNTNFFANTITTLLFTMKIGEKYVHSFNMKKYIEGKKNIQNKFKYTDKKILLIMYSRMKSNRNGT